jgi:hypothetical protein
MNHLIFVCKTEHSWGNYQIGFLFVNRDCVVIISPVSPIRELIVSSNTKKAFFFFFDNQQYKESIDYACLLDKIAT